VFSARFFADSGGFLRLFVLYVFSALFCIFIFVDVFLASFFVAFLTHFWRFLHAFLTSFCSPGSGPLAGSTPQRGTLAGLILVHICGSCGCPFFAELCPARRGRKSPRSTKVFTQKNVSIFFVSFIRAFKFFVFFEKTEKYNAIRKMHKKGKKQKPHTKKQKTKKKQLAQHKNKFQLKKFSKTLSAMVSEGYLPKRHVKSIQKIEEKGLKTACKKSAKNRHTPIFLLFCLLFCPPLF